MAFAFCPYCGGRLEGGFRFCPFCGSQVPTGFDPGSVSPRPTYPQPDPVGQRPTYPQPDPGQPTGGNKSAEYEKNLARAKAYCIRELWNDAAAIYERMIFDDPMDMNGYMGLIRVATRNYTCYDDPKIDENIRIAKKIGGKEDLSEFDPDFAAYSSPSSAGDFEIKDGVLVNYKGARTEVVIPEGVTEIADDVFSYNKTVKSVNLPTTLVRIGRRAFSWCESLTTVNFPESLRTIGECAFYHCDIVGLKLPRKLEEIGYEAFACGCADNEIIIPINVRTMGGRVFEYTIRSGKTDTAVTKSILCALDSKPDGWKESWHYAGTSDSSCVYHRVSWGYKG